MLILNLDSAALIQLKTEGNIKYRQRICADRQSWQILIIQVIAEFLFENEMII